MTHDEFKRKYGETGASTLLRNAADILVKHNNGAAALALRQLSLDLEHLLVGNAVPTKREPRTLEQLLSARNRDFTQEERDILDKWSRRMSAQGQQVASPNSYPNRQRRKDP